jgi:mRNA-decapping enzyme subunit 2
MVAPFLGPLKGWIKQQQKLDRQKTRTGAPSSAPPATAGVTDTEEMEADVGETTADEATLAEMQPAAGNFAELVARLGRGGRSSDALPEVSAQQTPQVSDPAAELKRLLSVGSLFPQQSPPVEAPAPAQDPRSNSLLAMLQSNNRPPGQLPMTPYEQLMSPPQLPQTPRGHQPRAPQLNHMSPPPPFPFQPQHHQSFPGPQHLQMFPQMPPQMPTHMSQQHFNGHPMQNQRQPMPPPPQHTNQMFPTRGPNMQEPEAFSHQAPRPYQRTGDPQFATDPQFPGSRGPVIPPASNLPPPKLNAHKLGLLNSFKMNEKPAASPPQQPVQPAQTTSRSQQPPALQRSYESFTSPQGLSANLYAPSPPPFTSPPPHPNFETLQPKPRNAHQDSLLTLFRSPSVPAAPTPPPKSPAELSAQPKTPGYMVARPASHEPMPPVPDVSSKPDLLALFTAPTKKPTLTSATVSGPVNAPDFETVKKNAVPGAVMGQGNSRGPSPANRKSVEQKMFVPQQILRRPSPSNSKTSQADTGDERRSRSPMVPANLSGPQPTAFKPQILRRPQQNAPQAPAPSIAPDIASVPAPVLASQPRALLDLFKTATPPPSVPQPIVPVLSSSPAPILASQPQALLNLFKTATPPPVLPTEQKNALLSLFGKPSQGTATSTSTPIPPTRSPRPPTPKTMMSGVISPVSPLPEKSQAGSPAHLMSRSRISSIGEGMAPNVTLLKPAPNTSHPSAAPLNLMTRNGTEDGYASAGSAGPSEKFAVDKNLGKVSGGDGTGKSPVDKTFLLGFLEDVARRGR